MDAIDHRQELSGKRITGTRDSSGRRSASMLNKVFRQIDVLDKGLDAAWKRNEVLANNIANADTPGFKRYDAEFEHVFQNALGDGSSSFFDASASGSAVNAAARFTQSGALRDEFRHAVAGGGGDFAEESFAGRMAQINRDVATNVSRDGDQSMRMDGNSVDVDYEMTELAKNALLYDSITYATSKEIGRIKIVLNEGR
jgi:flagellar basal-body rod protein FlgB